MVSVQEERRGARDARYNLHAVQTEQRGGKRGIDASIDEEHAEKERERRNVGGHERPEHERDTDRGVLSRLRGDWRERCMHASSSGGCHAGHWNPRVDVTLSPNGRLNIDKWKRVVRTGTFRIALLSVRVPRIHARRRKHAHAFG